MTANEGRPSGDADEAGASPGKASSTKLTARQSQDHGHESTNVAKSKNESLAKEHERTTAHRALSAEDRAQVDRVLALDEFEGRRLLREYGDELLEHLRWEPLTTLKELEADVARARRQVKHTVAGLYDGVDGNGPPQGWTFDDRGRGVLTQPDGTKSIKTWVNGPNGAEGYFERAYNPKTKVLELRMAFLRLSGNELALPNMVAKQGASPEMVTGKGTPTIQYVTMHQMRMLGVPLGGNGTVGVEKIHLSDIQNVETIVHLHYLRERYGHDPAALIEHTASVKYAETSAVQTGHERSGSPILVGGAESPIRELLEFQEAGNPKRRADNDKILANYGFDRDTVMLWGFDIDFPVGAKP